MREAIFPNNHPAIAASLYLKGRLLHTTGQQHKEAGPLFSEGTSDASIVFGTKASFVGAALLEVAELSREMGLPVEGRGNL